MSWIDKVLNATEESETPARFYWWSALAAISAVSSPNIFLDRFYYKLSPNIYVFLVGESGIRKGPAVNLATNLVRECDCTRVIKGRFTIQGLIKELGKSWTDKAGVLCPDSRAFIPVGEFASGLIYDPQGVSILTDLYDTAYNEDWKNTLSTVPINKLIKPCLTFLAASNETNFEASLPKEATSGGFIARMSVIHELNRKTINSLVYAPKVEFKIEDLAEYLKGVASIKGEFKYTSQGALFYNEWYTKFASVKYSDRTGTLNRIGDTILKVAMLIHLSKEKSLLLDEFDISEAIDKCISTVPGMRRVTVSSGNGDLAIKTKLVLNILMRKYPEGVKRSSILKSHCGELDYIDLDRIIENFEQSKAIIVHRVVKDIVYTIRDEVHEQYVKYANAKGWE